MANQVTGKIIYLSPTQKLKATQSGNEYDKREMAIAVQRYDPDTGIPSLDNDNTPMFSFIGDKCRLLDGLETGQTVTVSFILQGRRYRGNDGKEKIINDIRPIGVRLAGQQPAAPAPQQAQDAPNPAPEPQQPKGTDINDDLPF